ncbi:hypothetical protein NG2371_06325 [Nocardia gamkensis]|nr:hypothetical protein [Nocardia gamkensis]
MPCSLSMAAIVPRAGAMGVSSKVWAATSGAGYVL